MGTSSSYSPDESLATIIQEETWLQGALLSNLFFGILTTLCILSFIAIFNRRNQNHSRTRIVLMVYVAVLFVITTASQGLLLEWIQTGFITQRNYPGGPSAFFIDKYSIPTNFARMVLAVCANWMNESLLVWRCYVVCSPGERPWSVGVLIPLILVLFVFVSGSLFIHSILHSAAPVAYTLAYGISSLVLNVTATAFIAGRLLMYRQHAVIHLGHAQGQHYVSIAAVVVESAAVYTSFVVVVIVAYAIGSPATNMLQQIIGVVQTFTSLLIIHRVARGDRWNRNTSSEAELASVGSLWNTRVGTHPDPDVIQLDVVSTRQDGEASVSPKEDDHHA